MLTLASRTVNIPAVRADAGKARERDQTDCLRRLPGIGKSSIARGLAEQFGAVWLRIDSIEQAIRESGIAPGSIEDAGYRAAYAIAEDNLRLGLDVIGDSVNDCLLTRNAWREAGLQAGADVVEVETRTDLG